MSDERDMPGDLDYPLPDLQFGFDYGQFYVFGDPSWRALPDPPETRAINDAFTRKVGGVEGLVVVLSPAQFHFDATLSVEVWTGEPPLEQDDADHIVDIDLDAPHGALYIQSADMPEHAQVVWLRASGRYRARFEGRGYTAQQDTRLVKGGPDSYRAQLWPRTSDRPAELRRAWPGWDRLLNPAPTDGAPADTTPTDS